MSKERQWTEILRDGSHVVVRPIRTEDVPYLAAFLGRLSPQSRHLLFLGGIADLSQEALERICDPDHAHDMAYVAVDADARPEEQIGICRYASTDRAEGAEIAVAVADAWQHRGLGTLLLRHLIAYARDNGIRRLFSMDEASNYRMHRLARNLGFSVRPDPDDPRQVIYALDLDGPAAARRRSD